MSELLTLAEATNVVPLSKTTLYRVAERGDGPFLKVEGRWMVYVDELHAWVRSHGVRRQRPDEMPRARRSSFRQKVIDLESRRSA